MASSQNNLVDTSSSKRLQPGVYKITNFKSGTVVDLSAGDNKSIIGFPEHGGENQQWEFSLLGAGYSIRNVHSGYYITVEAGIYNGVPLVANPFPVSWALESDDFEEGIWRISWPNSPFGFELQNLGSPTPGTSLQLWERYPYESRRLWRLVMCETKSSATPSSVVDSPVTSTADMVIDAEGLKLGGDGELTITTSTTTTTTTVTKVKRVNCS